MLRSFVLAYRVAIPARVPTAEALTIVGQLNDAKRIQPRAVTLIWNRTRHAPTPGPWTLILINIFPDNNNIAARKGSCLKTGHIHIDFENVQPRDLALLKGREFKVTIFIGATQAKLPTEFVLAVQSLGPAAEYVRIDGSGRNALDFHIAYYLGRLSSGAPQGDCFIISKDSGFDPLIRHLKSSGITCRRLTAIADIPGLKEAAIKPTSDPIQKVLANLAKRGLAKPRTLKTLRSSIRNLLGTQGTEETVDKIVGELERLNTIKLTDGKVSYPSS